MITDKEFRVPVKEKSPVKVSVAAMLIQSNTVYKGDFETVEDLLKIPAFNGDYADVYETNTRWSFENTSWTDTKQPIPINPTLATKQDVATIKQDIAEAKQDVADAKQDISDTKQDVTAINVRVASLESVIANPKLVITKI